MIEVELKSVVPDLDRARSAVERAGGALVFAGRLEDRRFDTADHALEQRDHVLRLRTYRGEDGSTRATFEWKGATQQASGYKQREEIGTDVSDPQALEHMLQSLACNIVGAVDRLIWQYTLDDTVVRFERYPRMDDLVEVEGSPANIERAIAHLALPRDGFSADRLLDFTRRFELRTGARAAVSDAEFQALLAASAPHE